jgi:hypothetical protein
MTLDCVKVLFISNSESNIGFHSPGDIGLAFSHDFIAENWRARWGGNRECTRSFSEGRATSRGWLADFEWILFSEDATTWLP